MLDDSEFGVMFDDSEFGVTLDDSEFGVDGFDVDLEICVGSVFFLCFGSGGMTFLRFGGGLIPCV